MNLLYFVNIFLLLNIIFIFPYFRQTKKNLIWLVFIFIGVSALMISDLRLEFLPLSYLLIYVGAVAVMFLFVIVAVDSKYENQIVWFEPVLSIALTANNFIVGILYFFFTRQFSSENCDVNSFFDFKENMYETFLFTSKESVCLSCNNNDAAAKVFIDFVLNSNCMHDDLSLYHIVEYRSKDLYVFSEYFYSHHSFLLVIVGFILTVSMLVSLLIAKDFSNSKL